MVEDYSGKQWKCGCGGCGGSFRGERKKKKRKVTERKKWIVEKKKGNSRKLKIRFVIRKGLLVFELINMHDLLAKNQGTWTG